MKNNFISIDCETGGLDKSTEMHASKFPITEIALISYSGTSWDEISRYTTYIKGQKKEPNKTFENYIKGYAGYDDDLCYTKGALDHTNVTVEKLEKEGKDYKLVVKELCQEFAKAKNGRMLPILVGQNITYDIPFINYLFTYANVDLSKYISGYYDHFDTFQPHFIDTMWMARMIWEDRNSLGDIASKLGIQMFDAHQALNDVVATKAVHIEFMKLLRQDNVVVAQESNQKRKGFGF